MVEVGDLTNIKSEEETLIGQFRTEYKKALFVLDNEIKDLIEQGKEMNAIFLMNKNIKKIAEIHEVLSDLYSIVYDNMELLKGFGSERVKELNFELIPITSQLKEATNSTDKELERHVLREMRSIGYQQDHWILRKTFIREIEYMLDVLSIVIEPDFVPGEQNQEENEDKQERYIPSSVKISVWRRDQGKCIECGSKERLEYDHIIPLSRGGSNTDRNIQLLCQNCNRSKGSNLS